MSDTSSNAPVPGSANTSTLAPAANTAPETEDFQFIEFAKRYIGVLATVAAIPLLSNVLGVVPTPGTNEKLVVLSSFICLVTFAACFLFKGVIGGINRWGVGFRSLPAFVSFLFLLAGIGCTTQYMKVAPKPTDKQNQATGNKTTDATGNSDAGSSTGSVHGSAAMAPASARHGVVSGSPNAAAPPLKISPQGVQVTGVSTAPETAKPNARADGKTVDQMSTPQLFRYVLTKLIALYGKLVSLYREPVSLYLILYPLYIVALGIVLVASFTQQRGQTIQTLVDTDLHNASSDILHLLQAYSTFNGLRKINRCLDSMGDELFENLNRELTHLKNAKREVPGREAPRILAHLMDFDFKRYDAVSSNDLSFWYGQIREERALAEDYLRINMEAVVKKTLVSRIFILRDEDLRLALEKDMDDQDALDEGIKSPLVHVLRRQQQGGIGWAIAIEEEMDPGIMMNPLKNDFALAQIGQNSNSYNALTFFLGYRERDRRFLAGFGDTPENKMEIAAYEKHYASILAQCWLVNGQFKQNQDKLLKTAPIKAAIEGNTRQLKGRLNKAQEAPSKEGEAAKFLLEMPASQPAPCYFPTASLEGDILVKLRELYCYRQESKKWYDECLTTDGTEPKPKTEPRAPNKLTNQID